MRVLEVRWPELFRNSPERLEACGPEAGPSEVYWIRSVEARALGEKAADTQEYSGPNGGHDGVAARGYGLRPSLLMHVREVARHEDFRPGVLHASSGLVFRRTPVSRSGPGPAFHQLLLVGAFPAAPQPLVHLRSRLETLLAPRGFSFKEEEEDEGGAVNQVWVLSKGSGRVGRLAALPPPAGEGPWLCVVTLSLDLLALQLFSAPDWRLLWSRDPRFLEHFLPESPGPFRDFSLYPPAYTHDVSFWVEPDSFDELEFHALVRRVSAGAVREVALVDRFRHPHMGHASLCYHLTYQSSDRALSRSQALGMQLKLRQLLPLHLQVTLR